MTVVVGVANVNGQTWAIGRHDEKLFRVSWCKVRGCWHDARSGQIVRTTYINRDSEYEWLRTSYINGEITSDDFEELLEEVDIPDD